LLHLPETANHARERRRMMTRTIHSYLLSAALAAAVFTTGCTVHAGYYDPYYHDHHPVGGEVVFYQQWETETHRDHADLNHRNREEQREYWNWRHHHDDHHDDHH
jgi:hypothetical protein